jgi:hypothetical protein
MRAIKISTVQAVLNNCNSRINFTYYLDENNIKDRYIVSVKNIYTGKNASIVTNLNLKISEIIGTKKYHSIGGWLDKKTNLYYIDANLHFNNIESAKLLAIKNEQIAIYDTLENKEIYI